MELVNVLGCQKVFKNAGSLLLQSALKEIDRKTGHEAAKWLTIHPSVQQCCEAQLLELWSTLLGYVTWTTIITLIHFDEKWP